MWNAHRIPLMKIDLPFNKVWNEYKHTRNTWYVHQHKKKSSSLTSWHIYLDLDLESRSQAFMVVLYIFASRSQVYLHITMKGFHVLYISVFHEYRQLVIQLWSVLEMHLCQEQTQDNNWLYYLSNVESFNTTLCSILLSGRFSWSFSFYL